MKCVKTAIGYNVTLVSFLVGEIKNMHENERKTKYNDGSLAISTYLLLHCMGMASIMQNILHLPSVKSYLHKE